MNTGIRRSYKANPIFYYSKKLVPILWIRFDIINNLFLLTFIKAVFLKRKASAILQRLSRFVVVEIILQTPVLPNFPKQAKSHFYQRYKLTFPGTQKIFLVLHLLSIHLLTDLRWLSHPFLFPTVRSEN